MDPRTRMLLEAPIAPTLLRLAAPNVLVLVAQAAAGLIETYFIGKLGTDALAGVALVFPVVMLMQMMSAGAMGGGICLVDRARARRGAPRRRRCAGAACARDRARLRARLHARRAGRRALALRGDGRQRPCAGRGACLLQLGIRRRGAGLALQLARRRDPRHRQHGAARPGDLRRRRVPGPAVARADLRLGTVPGAWHRGRRGCVALSTTALGSRRAWRRICGPGRAWCGRRLRGVRFRWPLFRDILRVGAVAALVTVATNLTIMIGTALVGRVRTRRDRRLRHGRAARISAGAAGLRAGRPAGHHGRHGIGAGQRERALRTAWIGAAIAAVPHRSDRPLAPRPSRIAWLSLFDTDPAMLEAGARYLRIVGPFYGMFGLALSLYFASQGAGRLLWPLSAISRASALRRSAAGWRCAGAATLVRVPRAEPGARRLRTDQRRRGRRRRVVRAADMAMERERRPKGDRHGNEGAARSGFSRKSASQNGPFEFFH